MECALGQGQIKADEAIEQPEHGNPTHEDHYTWSQGEFVVQHVNPADNFSAVQSRVTGIAGSENIAAHRVKKYLIERGESVICKIIANRNVNTGTRSQRHIDEGDFCLWPLGIEGPNKLLRRFGLSGIVYNKPVRIQPTVQFFMPNQDAAADTNDYQKQGYAQSGITMTNNQGIS